MYGNLAYAYLKKEYKGSDRIYRGAGIFFFGGGATFFSHFYKKCLKSHFILYNFILFFKLQISGKQPEQGGRIFRLREQRSPPPGRKFCHFAKLGHFSNDPETQYLVVWLFGEILILWSNGPLLKFVEASPNRANNFRHGI